MALTVLLLATCCPPTARGQANVLGKWTHPYSVGIVPVHFVVAPCDSDTMQSQVVYWKGKSDVSTFGGILFMKIPTAASDVMPTDGSFPLPQSFANRALTAPAHDVFCAGHTRLGDQDGRIFVSGGTDSAAFEVGIRNNTIFDPETRQWDTTTVALTMNDRRWYSTATTLSDGKILIHSGSKYWDAHCFGGVRDSAGLSIEPHVITRLAVTREGQWDGRVSQSSGSQPSQRELHTAVAAPGAAMTIYFGGRDSLTNPSHPDLNDVWQARVGAATNNQDYDYLWQQIFPTTGSPLPSERYMHGASRRSNDNNNELVVYGGVQDTIGSVSTLPADVWVLNLQIIGASFNYKWYKATIDSSAVSPGIRCGHTMFRDDVHDRILMFGGSKSPTGAPTDNKVYTLTISGSGPPTSYTAKWDVLSISTALGPGPRASFAGAMDGVERTHSASDVMKHVRLFVFGGRDSTNTVKADLWQLAIIGTGSSAHGEWQKLTMTGQPDVPRQRMKAALAFEPDIRRVLLVGGDSTLTGGRSSEVWSTLVPDTLSPVGGSSGTWKRYATSSASPQGAISGLTADVWPGVYYPRNDEIFDPTGPTFSQLTQDPHLAEWYPFMFVVPDATNSHRRVFEAGPRKDTWLLDLDASDGSRWQQVDTSGPAGAPFKGGSAVMYRINKVMKCGSRDTDAHLLPSIRSVSTIDLGATPSQNPGALRWQARDSMAFTRVNHNLVLTPTGDVIAMGGTDRVGNEDEDAGNFVFNPELWHPDTSTPYWQTLALDADNMERGYHSTGILLPDGRILEGGGNNDLKHDPNDSWEKIQLFSPPYLYADAAGTPKTRIKILGMRAGVLTWGDTSTVVTDQQADSLVLIRGGASTHAFNQEQRFVPLFRFYPDSVRQGGHHYVIRIPARADSVPPGDYMLFAVKSGYAPSIARWVHVCSGSLKPSYDVGDVMRPGLAVLGFDSICPYVLGWNEPADDSLWAVTGRVQANDIRYTETGTLCPTCWSAFNAATQIGDAPAAGDPGTHQTYDTSGLLDIGHTYQLQMVTYDDHRAPGAPWTSRLSPKIQVHINGCGGMFAGSGGGGGGFAARGTRGTGPYSSQGAQGSFRENSALDGVAPGAWGETLLPLAAAPALVGENLHVQLRQGEGSATQLTGATLVAVDAAVGQPLALPERAVAGDVLPATSVTNSGTPVHEVLAGDDANPFYAYPRDSLVVSLPSGTAAPSDARLPFVIRAGGMPPPEAGDNAGIEIQVPDGSGAWRTLDRIVPHAQFVEFATDSVPGPSVRLIFRTEHEVSFVGRVVPRATSCTKHELAPVALQHSRLGSISTSALTDSSSGGVALAGGDTLSLSFPALAEPDSGARAWYLAIAGRNMSGPHTQLARSRPETQGLPTRFALLANRPNPFRGTTTIGFELPRASTVSVEIFDLAGRRIRTLGGAHFEAGRWTLEWDRRTQTGSLAAAGVYFDRMVAGSFRSQRKMIVAP